MRINNWLMADPGDTRTETWFAIFPVRISRETRWLEQVTVEYEYRFYGGGWSPCYKWQKNKFIDQEPAK